jgi:hypothetical protein
VRIAIATRALPEALSLAEAAVRVREAGADRLVLDLPGPVAPGAREDLREVGVRTAAVALREGGVGRGADAALEAGIARAIRAAHRLRAEAVVLGGAGGFDASRAARERAVDDAARRLHGRLRDGVPFVIRHGIASTDLLGLDETEWLLDALPGLGFLFDPFGANRRAAEGEGPPAETWAERFAKRTVLVAVRGEGEQDGGHPADSDVDWRQIAGLLSGDVTWVLETGPRAGDVSDAASYLLDRVGR